MCVCCVGTDEPLPELLSDLHVLVYLARYLDLTTQVIPLCDAIRTRTAIPPALEKVVYAVTSGARTSRAFCRTC